MTVRDLFGSMPVRVKQRAIEVERGIHSKHWELLKRDIIALILAWDRHVSVSIREPSNRWTFSVRNSQTNQDNEELGIDLTATVPKILYQTQLSDSNKPEDWVPLKASAGGLSVTGVVSLRPVATKRAQFISIGVHPVSNWYGSTNILYEEMNRIFSNSSYGVEEEEPGHAASNEREGGVEDAHYRRDGFTGQELKGRKGIDRWPMFYIKIQIDRRTNPIASKEMDEILDERYQNLASIVDILKAVTYEFLKKYYFRPKRIRNAKEDVASKILKLDVPKTSLSSKSDSRSKSATETRNKPLAGDLATTRLSIRRDHGSRSRPESPFDLWSRIKSGSHQQVVGDKIVDVKFADEGCQDPKPFGVITPDLSTNNSDSTPPLFGADGSLLRAPFATTNFMTPALEQRHPSVEVENGSSNEDIKWTNPLTKETLLIDPKTGFITNSPKCCSTDGCCSTADPKRRKQILSCRRPVSNANHSEWLGELLSSWENPVFKTTEPHIPSALSEENNSSRLTQPFGCNTWLQGSPEIGPPMQGRVSKAALRSAEIIAQVDRKFIFAKVLVDPHTCTIRGPHPTASPLLIIDQHAADERCRVESLMENYFERMDNAMSTAYLARTESLEQPLKFDISVRDATQLERTITHFAHWGIYYHVMPISLTGNVGPRQIQVTKLPPSIIERCRLEPRLLIELLRQETWKIEAQSHHGNSKKDTGTQDDEATTPHWITRFHGCPQGILDMINSRACRSSIMFNDPLSQAECANLVKRLAECAFPFQCAHGRPSMAPLVDLGDGDMASTSHKRTSAESFRQAFRTWNVKGRTNSHGT